MKFLKAFLATALCITSLHAMEEQPAYTPVGLKNTKNNCFINSAVQVAHAMPRVTQLASNSDFNEGSLSKAYTYLLEDMIKDKKSVDPIGLCIVGCDKLKIKVGSQSDAHDFLHKLLVDLADQNHDIASELYIMTKSTRYSMENNYFEDPRFEPRTSLTLTVQQDDTSLVSCLNRYFQPQKEFLTLGNYPIEADRQCFIEHTGPYLVFGLNRAGYKAKGKNNKTIYTRCSTMLTFPLYGLSMKGYFAEENNDNGPYELIGVIMHKGTGSGGHYTSYVKAGNQWYYCNDSAVKAVNEKDIETIASRGYGLTKNTLATTLVYERSHGRPGYQPAKNQRPHLTQPPKKPVSSRRGNNSRSIHAKGRRR